MVPRPRISGLGSFGERFSGPCTAGKRSRPLKTLHTRREAACAGSAFDRLELAVSGTTSPSTYSSARLVREPISRTLFRGPGPLGHSTGTGEYSRWEVVG